MSAALVCIDTPLSHKLLKSTGLVGGFTLLSRILGFARDLIIAGTFGANAGTDAFFVAFKIPNFLRRLFAEGAFAQAFVPVLSDYRERGDAAATRLFVAHLTGGFALILSLLTALGMIAAPVLIWLFAPGFHSQPEQYGLSVELLRLTFPYLFFICLTALAGGVLNTWNHFAIPAFTPVLLNLCMITAALGLAPRLERPIEALAWGVLAAGILQLAVQLPMMKQMGLLPRPRLDWKDPGVRRVLRLMAPALLGASVGQLNLLINTLIASLLTTGSISWLYYSDRLVEFPLGLLGVGLATVILPHLSRTEARNDRRAFAEALDWALRWLMLVGLPATLGLILLAEPLMYTLFQHDQFSPEDARMAARSLMAYGIGLMGFLGVKILVPGFSARQDLTTPARFAVYSVAVNLLLSLLLTLVIAPAGWRHAALALAASLASLCNAGLLGVRLIRLGVYRTRPGHATFLGRVLIGNLALAGTLMAATQMLGWEPLGPAHRAMQLLFCITLGMAVYGAALWLSGLRPRHLALSGEPA